MSIRGFSDIPNRYANLVLQEAGDIYDQVRGLPPLRKLVLMRGKTPAAAAYNENVECVLSYFDGRCAYCGGDRAAEDHLVPRNKDSAGLHAWGNVVPACKPCNDAKSSKDWMAHLDRLVASAVISDEVRQHRESAIRAMVAHFGYDPRVADLRPVLADLYRHTDLQARSLIQFAVAAMKPYLEELAELPPAAAPTRRAKH